MTIDIPELFPKLTEDQIKKAKDVGIGADLRNLINLLRFLGVFGRKANSNNHIAHRIYKTWPGPYTDSKGKIHDLNDRYANRRFDNIISGKLPLKEPELDYIKLCLHKAFGDMVNTKITDDEILKGQAHMLVRRLLSEAPSLSWHTIDPLHALLALSAIADPLRLDLNLFGADHRLPDDSDDDETCYSFLYHDADLQILHPGSRFTLSIPKEEARTKPLVLAWSESIGRTEVGKIEARAKQMRHVVRTEDKTGPWRVSKPQNKPIVIPDTDYGRFGFLAIADLGHSVEQLFPEDFDSQAITNEDLQYLYEQIALIMTSGDIPKMGLIHYEVR